MLGTELNIEEIYVHLRVTDFYHHRSDEWNLQVKISVMYTV